MATEQNFRGRLLAAFSLRRNLRALWHQSPGSFTSLDGFRAIAALWVVTFHCFGIPAVNPATAASMARFANSFVFNTVFAGHLAVDIFLVLAGFLMAHLLLNEIESTGTIHFWNFVRRRWMRIVPLYAAVMVLYMIDDPVQLASCARWGWSNLFFVNNFFGDQLKPQSCLGHGWSLAVEFQLYLVTPIVVYWMCARPRFLRSRQAVRFGLFVPALLILLGMIVSSAIVLWYRAHPFVDWYNTAVYDKPYCRSAPYFAGMAAAYWVRHTRAAANKFFAGDLLSLFVDLFALLAGAAVLFTPPSFIEAHAQLKLFLWLFGRQIFGLSVAYIAFRTATGGMRIINRALSWQAWNPIARLSYAAYLVQFVCVHPMCVRWSARMAQAKNFSELLVALGAETAASLSLTFALALVFHLLVEKPFMNLRR